MSGSKQKKSKPKKAKEEKPKKEKFRIKQALNKWVAKRQAAKKRRFAKTTCDNCGTALTGEFCHVCGQKGVEMRRPVIGLERRAIELNQNHFH